MTTKTQCNVTSLFREYDKKPSCSRDTDAHTHTHTQKSRLQKRECTRHESEEREREKERLLNVGQKGNVKKADRNTPFDCRNTFDASRMKSFQQYPHGQDLLRIDGGVKLRVGKW
jgi:hypothetical protein